MNGFGSFKELVEKYRLRKYPVEMFLNDLAEFRFCEVWEHIHGLPIMIQKKRTPKMLIEMIKYYDHECSVIEIFGIWDEEKLLKRIKQELIK